MHRDFKTEAEKPWQFANDYVAIAKPCEFESRSRAGDAMDVGDSDYDVNRAWQQLRQRHASECWQFVQQHQKKYLQHLENTTRRVFLCKEALDAATSFMSSLPACYTEADRARIGVRFRPGLSFSVAHFRCAQFSSSCSARKGNKKATGARHRASPVGSHGSADFPGSLGTRGPGRQAETGSRGTKHEIRSSNHRASTICSWKCIGESP